MGIATHPLTYNIHEIKVGIGRQTRYETAERKCGHALGKDGREIASKAAEVRQYQGWHTSNFIRQQTIEQRTDNRPNEEQRLSNARLIR